MDNLLYSMSDWEPRFPKDNAKADSFRMEGNEHFGRKSNEGFEKALRSYNKSICFAENGSQQLAIGYANRSAIYIELNLFKECLANIEMARSVVQYPEHLNEKLAAREMRCRKLMATTPPVMEALKPELSYPPHEKIPFVANCVEICRNVKYGRHLITNRDLKVGDIVAIEKPFCTLVAGNRRYDRCENCTEEHSRSLIPCKSCTAVMFCSAECRAEAMQTFHKYECAAIDFITGKFGDPDLMLPFRLAFSALAMFNGDTKALFDYSEEADLNCDDTTVFEIDYTKRLTPFGKFAPVYCMINAKAEKNDAFAARLKPMLSLLLNLCNVVDDSFDETIIEHMRKIFDHFSTVLSPGIRINNYRDTILSSVVAALGPQYTEQSRGVYPLRYLFNHSCIPNVITTPYGSHLVMTITRPVKAGEQLFDCYGTKFFMFAREERRKMHRTFRCKCDACEKDYPYLTDLGWSPIKMPQSIINAELLVASEPRTREKASKFVQIAADHIHKIDKHQPCKDYALLSQSFARCVLILYEKENLDFLEKIDQDVTAFLVQKLAKKQ